jgi:uncharacterized protein (DUF433 family)
MTAVARFYTPAEAAAVSEVGVKAVHNAIDKKIVQGREEGHTLGSSRRRLTESDLLRLKLWYGVGSTLSADRRRRLFEAIKAEPTAATVRADDLLIVDVDEARRQIEVRMRSLEAAEAIIHSVDGVLGGEPVFRDTRIPARMIASMRAQGANVEELVEGYRPLTPRMIELAVIWSAAHPARGRPKTLADHGLKPKSVRRLSLPAA